MTKIRLTRRALIGSTFSLMTLFKPADARNRGRDRGIGGTGVIVESPPEDRGIGGTGVIGTIRQFGSIIVNDLRIAYPSDALVEIDGRPGSSADLRLGQVVHVVADQTTAGYATQRISVASEVVGPIEAVGKRSLTVLGQTVSTEFVEAKGWKTGQWIAVAGLRNLDGSIVASHVQYRDDSVARVAGPVTVAPDGAVKIGGLTLVNLDPSLAGQRVLAEVGRSNGQPAAVKTVVNPELSTMANVRQLSIETYVARNGHLARFGSGIIVTTGSGSGGANQNSAGSSSTPSRAIVTVTVNPDGSLTAVNQRLAPEPDTTFPDRTKANPYLPQHNPEGTTHSRQTPTELRKNNSKTPTKTGSEPMSYTAGAKPKVGPPAIHSGPPTAAPSSTPPHSLPEPPQGRRH